MVGYILFQVMKHFQHYKKRWLAKRLKEALAVAPVVVLTGARQVGKSTLLLNEAPFKEWLRFSLDDPEILHFALEHPKDLVNSAPNMVIDEVQKAPKLLSYIKLAVDENRQRRFVLSGSANLLLMKNVSESLAGRAIYFELLPFSFAEDKEKSSWLASFIENKFETPFWQEVKCSEELEFLIFRGFIPPITVFSSPSEIALWWKGYIATYLERDLRDLSQIANLADFHRFMEILALRTASILKQNEAARDAGISTATASRYVNLLETSNLFFRLRPFFKNISKRLIKTPKAYFIDTGLTCALAGFKKPIDIPRKFYAQLFESFVFQNLYALSIYFQGNLYYFRTLGGKEIEIDFLLEIENRLMAIEVKYKPTIGIKDAEALLKLEDLLGKNIPLALKAIIYTGDEIKFLPGNILLLPWWSI
jgi:predicted AAA+ superfamily ATPase